MFANQKGMIYIMDIVNRIMRNRPMPTASRFYEPCLQVLRRNAPNAMGVSEIIEAVRQENPEQDFRTSNGGVRAMLMRVSANDNSSVRMVQGCQPPKFYVAQASENSSAERVTPLNSGRSEEGQIGRCNSIFYEPACAILKANAPAQMSAGEIARAIIEQYPDLEWSRSQGPVRAMLLSAAKLEHTPIRQVPDVLPPKFFYREMISNDGDTDVPEASAEEIMGNAFAQTQSVLKSRLLDRIMSMGWEPFKHLANRLVAKMLFGEAEDTPGSGDGGIDGYVNIHADPLGLNTIGVQVKHYAAGENVQRPEIQQFIGALHGKNGVFVTCSDFSRKAREEAERSTPSKIVLINGKQLVEYMIKYKVGVRETGISYSLAEIDDAFFDEL